MKKLVLMLAFAGLVGSVSAITKGDDKDKDKDKKKECCKKEGKCCKKDGKACSGEKKADAPKEEKKN